MTAAGLIFSNIHDKNIPDMTARRTMASLPFGGRYRLIDFTLSNMVNSEITKIGVVTHNNYRSLMDHIGTGKDWDLARRSGGIMILPPFITAYDNPHANKLYSTRLEALMGVMDFINHCSEDVIVLSDCDIICNIDLSDVLDRHERTGADMTLVTKKVYLDETSGTQSIPSVVFSDEDDNITDFVEYTQLMSGLHEVSTNIMVFTRTFLIALLHNAISHGYTEFYHQALPYSIDTSKYCVYRFNGYCAEIGSLSHYFSSSMELLDSAVRAQLFSVKDRPIYTKVRNSTPTQYGESSVVTNSLIADGCIIDGTVENSILFRGVRIRKGTTVRNSIMLQDSCTGENVSLNCVITDKNVLIRDGRNLSGHETLPFYIAKGKMI